jgi:hypothetical protein
VSTPRDIAIAQVRAELNDSTSSGPNRAGLFSVRLPGTRKLVTECALEVGQHGMIVRAFVARKPMRTKRRLPMVVGTQSQTSWHLLCPRRVRRHLSRGPGAVELVTRAAVDRLLGAVAESADESFNVILELGFAESIRSEWAWRRSRGESTANLAAFTHLDPGARGGVVPPGIGTDPGESSKS